VGIVPRVFPAFCIIRSGADWNIREFPKLPLVDLAAHGSVAFVTIRQTFRDRFNNIYDKPGEFLLFKLSLRITLIGYVRVLVLKYTVKNILSLPSFLSLSLSLSPLHTYAL